MKQKPSIFFIVGLAVAVVLIVGSAVLLFLGFRKLSGARKNLDVAKKKLEQFHEQKPFAAQRNVEREAANSDTLKDWYSNLVEIASADQLNIVDRSPTKFTSRLGKTKSRIEARARKEGVEFSSSLGLGFETYFGEEGTPPPPGQVPRLTEQLIIAEELCGVLIDEKIEKIESMKREEFETAKMGRGGRTDRRRGVAVLTNRPDAGQFGEDDLYAYFRFRVRFVATERAVVGILNRLSSHERFFVPVLVKLEKEDDDIKTVEFEVFPANDDDRDVTKEGAGESDEEGDPVVDEEARRAEIEAYLKQQPASERLICGLPLEKPAIVTLTFDVFKFRKAPEA